MVYFLMERNENKIKIYRGKIPFLFPSKQTHSLPTPKQSFMRSKDEILIIHKYNSRWQTKEIKNLKKKEAMSEIQNLNVFSEKYISIIHN